MSFLQLARKIAVGASVAFAAPALLFGQTNYAPQGGEYNIAGALLGDQVRPALGISASGGYLVWQDNATDGDGWGIRARALDNSLNGVLSPFRVNSTAKYDQENARVALLNNGGSVFVWQGGRQGFQHIYARFLSSSNTWLGLDQMVNASTKVFQANPAVAVLSNGNVVIAYASYNTNTMQDVYGQIFSPAGQKIGGEFQLNQFTAFNQRTPAVVAFNDGFIAAWISEQQRTAVQVPDPNTAIPASQLVFPSVDVYARLFDSNGAPSIAEFCVNSSSNACANPAIATTPDGTVMFAWSGHDSQVRNNSWDIYARPFTFPSLMSYVPGIEQRVNTQLYGDQFAPQIAAQGSTYLVTWTSLGQDGSGAGVYGQFLTADGSRSGGEFRVNSTTLGSQQEPAIASDNSGRFLAAWTGPTYTTSQNDLFAQIYSNGTYVPPNSPTNYGAPTFVGDNPIPASTGVTNVYTSPYYELPTLDYPGTIAFGGSDVPTNNAFALAAGNYNGLFYSQTGVSSTSAGYVSIKVNKNKSFSGTISIGGKSYSLGSGTFDDLGKTTKIVPRSGSSALVVVLQLDLFGGNQIQGTVKSGTDWTASLVADRQSGASSYAGAYTLIIPGSQSGPAGSGFGTVTISSSGTVAFSGKLADGTPITQSSTISKAGIWPLYYNKGSEFVMGWVEFNIAPPNNNSTGDIIWTKPAQTSASVYSVGFTNEVTGTAELNQPATQGARQLTISGGGLSSSVSYPVQIGAHNKVLNLSTNKMKMSVSTSGVFTGNATLDGKSISFQGALLNGGGGEGFFINGNLSGKVNLE
jgi:hypothetical protein